MAEQQTTTIPGPKRAPGTERFWQAAMDGKLLLRRCTKCNEFHYYPRPQCPFCWGDTEWVEAKGTGEIYTYSEMARAEPAYVIAYVKLDEGVSMMTHIVDCDPKALKVGQKVRVVFRAAQDGTIAPMFTPQ
ncbi:Zn-ribbon domain-containing OB-fold protein [Ramlibacter sp.]|uniref:Zn-ribbon domain-containing OB-fold protein n=1 Tax=Ramlibacter sp. TaxID=1917967 RepID=UPI003D135F87